MKDGILVGMIQTFRSREQLAKIINRNRDIDSMNEV